MSDFFIKFLKFFTVGGLGFGVDFFTTWLFKEKLQLKKMQANSIGFALGILFRFVANRLWTFESTDPNWHVQLFKFSLIALVGLGIVNGIIYLLNEKWKLMGFYPAKIASMFVFFAYNFTANYFWTF